MRKRGNSSKWFPLRATNGPYQSMHGTRGFIMVCGMRKNEMTVTEMEQSRV